jgi:hypothetical protein
MSMIILEEHDIVPATEVDPESDSKVCMCNCFCLSVCLSVCLSKCSNACITIKNLRLSI